LNKTTSCKVYLTYNDLLPNNPGMYQFLRACSGMCGMIYKFSSGIQIINYISLGNIYRLDLSNTGIRNVLFLKNINIVQLNISNTSVDKIDFLTSLELLDVSINRRLTEIPYTLVNLTWLNITDTRINHISCNLNKLRYLHMSNMIHKKFNQRDIPDNVKIIITEIDLQTNLKNILGLKYKSILNENYIEWRK
jgi:Leucine-rich repeat (LRR) protein